jgi:hypothetical protein
MIISDFVRETGVRRQIQAKNNARQNESEEENGMRGKRIGEN